MRPMNLATWLLIGAVVVAAGAGVLVGFARNPNVIQRIATAVFSGLGVLLVLIVVIALTMIWIMDRQQEPTQLFLLRRKEPETGRRQETDQVA